MVCKNLLCVMVIIINLGQLGNTIKKIEISRLSLKLFKCLLWLADQWVTILFFQWTEEKFPFTDSVDSISRFENVCQYSTSGTMKWLFLITCLGNLLLVIFLLVKKAKPRQGINAIRPIKIQFPIYFIV